MARRLSGSTRACSAEATWFAESSTVLKWLAMRTGQCVSGFPCLGPPHPVTRARACIHSFLCLSACVSRFHADVLLCEAVFPVLRQRCTWYATHRWSSLRRAQRSTFVCLRVCAVPYLAPVCSSALAFFCFPGTASVGRLSVRLCFLFFVGEVSRLARLRCRSPLL